VNRPTPRHRPIARAGRLARLALLTLALAACATSREPTRIVAVGDVHGGHAQLVALLRAADLVDADGNWTGMLSDADAAGVDMSKVDYLTGPAGSITVHNARALHYSPSSKSAMPRPLLLNCYSSADAKPYTPHPDPSAHAYEVVRGAAVKWAEHDPRPCQIPPDWSGGYTSIYAAQAGEDKAAGMM